MKDFETTTAVPESNRLAGDQTAQIAAERKVHSVQTDIHDLVSMRANDETEHLLEPLEANLLASLAMLQFLCADLRETRRARYQQAAE